MIDASIALLKCVIDYGLCIWAFSWFAKRKSENRALFLGSIFLSSLFLFGINMLEIPWLNTIVICVYFISIISCCFLYTLATSFTFGTYIGDIMRYLRIHTTINYVCSYRKQSCADNRNND